MAWPVYNNNSMDYRSISDRIAFPVYEQDGVYQGETDVVPMFYPQVFNTKHKLMTENFTVEPIPTSTTGTAGTDGYTLSIWSYDPYPLQDAPGLEES